MRCYLIRHGRDNDSVRGGWSMHPLTEEGNKEIMSLADTIASWREEHLFRCIYSSDLPRAMDTAEILSARIHAPIIPTPEFRETNNGDLAGMDNALALMKYPGLFWNQMEWEQCYPNGESPCQFCERITNAWNSFSAMILKKGKNVLSLLMAVSFRLFYLLFTALLIRISVPFNLLHMAI